MEREVILEIPLCWNCGHDKTVTQVAWDYVYPDDEEKPFVSCQKLSLPMTAYTPAMMMSLPSVPGATIHTDYCAKCGAQRVTMVEKVSIPGQVFAAMMGQPPR